MKRSEVLGAALASAIAFLFLMPFSPVQDHGRASALYTGPEYWGIVETFAGVSMGRHGPDSFNDVTIFNLFEETNITGDTVVLDGWLYEMTRADARGTAVLYAPSGPAERTDDWNLSVEITRTKEDSHYEAVGLSYEAGYQGIDLYLCNETNDIQAGVRLVTGAPENESVKVGDPISMIWTEASQDVLPPMTHETDLFGLRPDRYIVSFSHVAGTQAVTVTVINSGTGVVYSGSLTVSTSTAMLWPKLRIDMEVDTGHVGDYAVCTGWVIDNLMFRSLQSRHPITEPAYEFVKVSDPLWIQVTDAYGGAIMDATVTIGGASASYNATTGRYESLVPRAAGWDVKYGYTVVADGVIVSDTVSVTTVMDPLPGVEISRWWNGWDWTSVFGRDDSSYATAANDTYKLFDHPTTSYMSSAFEGNSSDLLYSQSEIALHYPHDWKLTGHRIWTEALDAAEIGHAMLDDMYTFASRWDDPAYVGVGDMYISGANPGNTASWEFMFAQYLSGTRLMGTSSWTYLGGNSSLIGSYWLNLHTEELFPAWNSWHPHTKADLLDMFRSVNTDNDVEDYMRRIYATAENGGVLRFYNHDMVANATMLFWVCDPKVDYPYENWKATDGEVASYINGRWSTDVRLNPSSTQHKLVYDVSRKDPISDGYWRVPVTVAFDVKDMSVEYVRVKSGSWDLNSSDGSLKYLNRSREMDVGYDIRGDTLYISHFWNASSQIEIKVNLLANPRIISEGVPSGIAFEEYSTVVSCTEPDAGPSVWSLATNASWLAMGSSNDTSCVVSGTTTTQGNYYANVTVTDGNTTSYLNWTFAITKLKKVSGLVLDDAGSPIPDLLVFVVMRDGAADRTTLMDRTDENGSYSVSFANDEWFVGDTILVTATYDNRTEENATAAIATAEQAVNLRFDSEDGGSDMLWIALVASGIAAVAVAVFLIWRYRRSVKGA